MSRLIQEFDKAQHITWRVRCEPSYCSKWCEKGQRKKSETLGVKNDLGMRKTTELSVLKCTLFSKKTGIYSEIFIQRGSIWHSHFIVGAMYELRLICRHHKKILDPVGIPLLGRLKYQAMNSALQSSYCLWEWPSKTRRVRRNARYHPPEARSRGWYIASV